MTWSLISGVAGTSLLGISLLISLRMHGSRCGMRFWIQGLARPALIAGPVALVESCISHGAGMCVLPIVVAAGWFGETPLGMMNFMVLQWFGVRLAREIKWTETSGAQITTHALDARSDREIARIAVGSEHLRDRQAMTRWFILRWVWPLTGWWSEYRWIARRP